MGERKQYSERTKRATLARLERNGGNRYKTEKETGIPHSTMARWIKEAEARGEMQPLPPPPPSPLDTAPLDDQLERLARQLFVASLEKVEDANLSQVVGALKMVLERLDRVKHEEDESGDVYERLAHLIAQYAPDRAAAAGLICDDEA